MRVLVVGGYGLIGLEVVRALRADGHDVVGLARVANRGRRLCPGIPWIGADLRRMLRPGDWTAALSEIDAVVNASGALQDGSRDDLALVQDKSIRALVSECERRGMRQFVQISAPGAEPGGKTAFLYTKAAADEALRQSRLDWTILKPGLVIGVGAYGGTTLLRMLAATPFVQPLVLAEAKIQTVACRDVAEAVCAVLAGKVASKQDYDLVEDEAHTLADIVTAMRRWVGRDDALYVWRLPKWIGFKLARLADLAGWFGWRSPLRTTALKALARNVTGDPAPWREAGGLRLTPLEETLEAMPATMQERVFGRVQLVFPFLVVTLAAFWLASGIIGVVERDQAAALIADKTGPEAAIYLAVLGAALDIWIGWMVLWRRWTRFATWWSIAVSIGYLVGGTILLPQMWADPLGAFVKVFPAMALALAVAALVEER